MNDMIMVSVDDHMVEPPDMWKNHVPAKWADRAPKVVRNADGVDEWVFEGVATSTPFGLTASVGWPSEEWDLAAGRFSDLRTGCFDVHERVRDMNANGVLASMNFPTMAGWNARTFAEASDKELGVVMLKAYNDWVLDEWCASYPGRFIPCCLVPLWDLDATVEEVHRVSKKGCRSISFVEMPHIKGYPSFLSGHWDPMLRAIVDENMVLSLHIGAGLESLTLAPEMPMDHIMILAPSVSLLTAQDLVFGPTLRTFPDLRVALSEGGIGWIPFYLDKIDHHYENQQWIMKSERGFGPIRPSEVFRRQILACFITDPSGLLNRNLIGIDNIAWECDYPHTDTTWPHSPEKLWGEFQAAGVTDKVEIDKISFENACRFYEWDPFKHTRREDATVGALRALATDVDTTRVSREEWRKRNAAVGIV